MQYVYKDEPLDFIFDFKIGDDFVSPDEGVYRYKLRTLDGTVLTQGTVHLDPDIINDGEEDITTYPDSASLPISAKYNTLEEGALFEGRLVEVKYSYNNRPQVLMVPYRITDFFYFTASAKDVRDYYGLNRGELKDEDIDLNDVYFQLVQKHGEKFTTALSSPGIASIRANRLIVLKGVVQVFSSVRIRVNQEENDGSSKFIRYLNKIDWDALLADALAEIEDLENNLTGEEVFNAADYSPFYLGAVRDAITGEES